MIITERLKINGIETPLAGFTVRTPSGGLGQSVTIALVDPDLDLVPQNADISFEIGIGKETAPGVITYSWISILNGGRLNGLNYSAGWVGDENGGYPNDIIEFNSLSPLADRLGLAPKTPLIMFDPVKVDVNSLQTDNTQLIKVLEDNGSYSTLTPFNESVEGLSFYKILDRAYTNKTSLSETGAGCGFNRVFTNIPDFPHSRIDFDLFTGWHSPVAALYSIYEPVIFEDNNVLYIISPEFGLPSNFIATQLNQNCVIEVNRSQDTQSLVNAILLTYENDQTRTGYAGEYPSIEFINEPPFENGSGASYTRTEVERKITFYKDLFTNETRRFQENYIKTSVFAFRPFRSVTTDVDNNVVAEVDLNSGDVRLISEEIIENTFTGFIKDGHTRTTSALYLNPDSPAAPYKWGEVEKEECRLYWRPDLQHPGQYELVKSVTEVTGLCLVENIEIEEKFPPTGQTIKYTQKIHTPILDAVDTGLVTGDGTQTLANLPLYTILETLRDAGQNQSNIETRVINHLTGGAKPPKITSRTGSRSTYIPPFTVKWGGGNSNQSKELIKNQSSINDYGFRKITTLDIGTLDPALGRQIAKRRLKVFENPPKVFSILLPGINFLYRRGTVIIPPLRSGYDKNCIITGTTIQGRALHTENAIRDMRIEAKELINVHD